MDRGVPSPPPGPPTEDAPPQDAPPQVANQNVIQVGPNDVIKQVPQPLFGPPVGNLVPFEPNGHISFSGWMQLFEN